MSRRPSTTQDDGTRSRGSSSGREGRLLTTGQVARKLGWDIRAIRSHCEKGDVPSVTIGKRRYIPGWWLDALLAQIMPPHGASL